MIKLGDTLSHSTGRVYDSEQILKCEVIEIENQLNKIIYTIKVTDESRVMAFYIKSSEFTGSKILALYDAGLYHLSHDKKLSNEQSWDLSFISDDETFEACPNCACETEITCNGESSCKFCGHEKVLPCSECFEYNDYNLCDWDKETRCTPFPK